jgi:outer membrane protein assembly factor BamB
MVRVFGRLLIILSFALWLAGCQALSNVTSGSDNVEPPTPLESFKTSVQIDKQWNANVGRGTDKLYLRLEPAVTAKYVYAADNLGQVVALDRDTGQPVWRKHIKERISAGVSADKRHVVLVTGNAQVVALDAKTGEERWRASATTKALAPPALGHGLVLVKTMDDVVVALDAKTGEKRWQYQHDTTPLRLHTSSAVQIHDRYAIVGFADGKIVILNLQNGRVVWERRVAQPRGATQLKRVVSIDANPIVERDVLYVVTFQGYLMAIEMRTGETLWRKSFSSNTGMAIKGNYLVITDEQGHVWALDKRSGHVFWRNKKLHARHATAPAIVNNVVVVGDSEGYIHWLALDTGEFVARTRMANKAAIYAPPVVRDKQVLILNSKGVLSSFKPGGKIPMTPPAQPQDKKS